MTDYNSIDLRPYNPLFAQLYTERGSILLNVEQLEWLAANVATLRIAASQLRRLQDERELTRDEKAPDTQPSIPTAKG